ncbi:MULTISPECIES: septum site-determining protein MinC [Bacillaceae]|uniref:septum site-determining protein MinC n=1 Tax=Bacillaceae TaxID=186817 RepID=UPI001C58F5F3|nr:MULTISPECIES: septum site-determining protein MinC [Rossellomorea]MBW3111861.1 septum site-determining protein MinC [Bacillus sp. MCCB 382]MDX8342002.1 septum site-determining protein MinC [Rossellomorea sp. YZS02]
MNKKPNVMIKGTKEGLTLHLNDQCSFHELKKELDDKLSAHYRETEGTPLLTVNIQTGNRYLTEDQVEELKEIVRQKRNLVVNEVLSNVITKNDAEKLIDERNIETLTGVIRSGQVVETAGDILIVGDVNPGGKVLAGGNIYILGSLKGIAHAGCNGNQEAVIVASKMVPSQLRIADSLNRSPDRVEEEDDREMECAYVDDSGQIVVDRLQVLKHLRPNITSFKGGS